MAKNVPSRLIYAAKISAARGLLNRSQGELAECAGVSKQSVTRIEKGRVRRTVSRDKLLPPSA